MTIELERFELENLLQEASERGAKNALRELGLAPKFINQTKAWERYGRGTVERWVQEGLVRRKKDGNDSATVRYEIEELDRVASQSNRVTYISPKDRKYKKVIS